MKKRKSLFGLILMALVLFIGVGYAAVSAVNFSITGSVGAASYQADVYFSAVTENDNVEKNIDVTAIINNENKATATMGVTGLKAVNDSASAVFTITNNEASLGTSIDAITIGYDNAETFTKYFEVTTSLSANSIAAKGTATLTVTVKMIKVPVALSTPEEFTISFVATPTELQ